MPKLTAQERLIEDLKSRGTPQVGATNTGSFCVAGNRNCPKTNTGGDTCIIDGIEYFVKGFQYCHVDNNIKNKHLTHT